MLAKKREFKKRENVKNYSGVSSIEMTIFIQYLNLPCFKFNTFAMILVRMTPILLLALLRSSRTLSATDAPVLSLHPWTPKQNDVV
jgi:hypothetical protein